MIKLYRQGTTIREIVTAAHLSFSDIGKIIRKTNGLKDKGQDMKDKSIETRAIYLFSIGKTPLEVAIELNLPASEVQISRGVLGVEPALRPGICLWRDQKLSAIISKVISFFKRIWNAQSINLVHLAPRNTNAKLQRKIKESCF